ncbi:MAG TPA: sigma 54-interacting transcriptional regulator [Vicinamibacterales bacterium]|nr:sigma 54-interacting transcriptional regulator [Vicinamibacterales bacterium]
MMPGPSRVELARLRDEARAVVRSVAVGFARRLDDDHVSVLCSHANGISEQIVGTADAPEALLPAADGRRGVGAADLCANPEGAVEWQLRLTGVTQIASVDVPSSSEPTRFWIGLADAAPPAPDTLAAIETIGRRSLPILNRAPSAEESVEHLLRLEAAAALLPTLGQVLDVGDVIEHLSIVARRALPHDLLFLRFFGDDLSKIVLFARNARGVDIDPVLPHLYPPALTRTWNFDIIDDLACHPLERDRPPLWMGARSSIRVPIKLDDRVVGGIAFMSFEPHTYAIDDVEVGRRLADHLAVAVSRQRLVEQARQNETLSVRATKSAALVKRDDEATPRASTLELRVKSLAEELDAGTGYRRVVGDSPQWRGVLRQAMQVASTDTTSLLLGESGTGKEVIARFLHRASPRAAGPFVALNCAALPEQLLEAELFGYERGAFTGATQSKPGQLEQAAGGTLFLDEVGEMSPSAQAKFLRVLQEREFQRLGGTRVLRTDARIVAATNRDLRRAIAQGHFREDLFYRLNVFAIRLPPLRDRRDDILVLAEAFLADIARGLGCPPAGISRDARRMLIDYSWPGNVRELRNSLERAAILCDGGLITTDHLSLCPLPAAVAPPDTTKRAGPASPPSSIDELRSIERSMIEEALREARYNKSKAAKALGLTRQQLYVRLRKHAIE